MIVSRFPALSAGCKVFFALCYIWAKFPICKYEMWLWHKGEARENATTTGIPLNNIHLAKLVYNRQTWKAIYLYLFTSFCPQVHLSKIYSLLDRVSPHEGANSLWNRILYHGKLRQELADSNQRMELEGKPAECAREWSVGREGLGWSNSTVLRLRWGNIYESLFVFLSIIYN